MRIFINPGHCPGLDSGAVNRTYGTQECDIALQIGNQLASNLEAIGIESIVVQDDSLGKVCRAANANEADYFISIHCNAFNEIARGTETYCAYLGGEGEMLATAIQNSIVNKLNTTDRGVKTANYYVLQHTEMPAVLVECEFIDNNRACELLMDNTDLFADAITDGVVNFLMEVSNG